MNPNTTFWLINSAGWLSYLLFAGLFFAYLSGNLTAHTLVIQAFSFCYYVLATGLFRKAINQLGWFTEKKHHKLIPILFALTLLIALLGQFLVSLFMMYGLGIMNWSSYSVPVLMMTTVQNWIIMCLWTVLYLMLKQARINRQQKFKHIQLESALHATELKALKAQLNPHFIFNCLNNMRALAIDDGQKTREMITNLSEILKYSFQFGEQTQVTVAKELQHVKNYLALEDIQFEQRLSYEFDIDSSTQQQLIPTLSIQLLVENAIKHGIMGSPDGGQIKIQVKHEGEHLLICVSNTGTLIALNDQESSSGVGLVNLKKRLNLIYSDKASFKLTAINYNQVVAEILIPMESSK